jgi:hypothetical protein
MPCFSSSRAAELARLPTPEYDLSRMHAVRSRALALLALLLVALPVVAAGGDQYFCHGMGRVMADACCCSSGHARASATQTSRGPEIKARDCCERVEGGANDSVVAVREAAPSVFSPALAIVPASVALVPKREIRALGESAQARAPPRRGAPIFLKNCSLLT